VAFGTTREQTDADALLKAGFRLREAMLPQVFHEVSIKILGIKILGLANSCQCPSSSFGCWKGTLSGTSKATEPAFRVFLCFICWAASVGL
jgi:hypothetical protein